MHHTESLASSSASVNSDMLTSASPTRSSTSSVSSQFLVSVLNFLCVLATGDAWLRLWTLLVLHYQYLQSHRRLVRLLTAAYTHRRYCGAISPLRLAARHQSTRPCRRHCLTSASAAAAATAPGAHSVPPETCLHKPAATHGALTARLHPLLRGGSAGLLHYCLTHQPRRRHYCRPAAAKPIHQ